MAQGHELQFGLTPSAIEILQRDERLAYGEFITETSLAFLTDPLAEAIRRDGDEDYIALRYAGEFGAIRVAASAHANTDGDGQIYAIAGEFAGTFGNGVDYTAGAGVETLHSDTTDAFTRYYLAAGATYNEFDVTVEYLFGDSPITGTDSTSLSTEIRYEPEASGVLDDMAFAFEYTFLSANGSAEFELIGVGAEYTHASGLGLAGAVVRQNTSSDQTDLLVLEAFLTF